MSNENSADNSAGMNAAADANASAAKATENPSRAHGAFSRTRDAAAGVNRTLAPTVKATGARLGDWLATVGWGKFFVVAILLLILSAIVDNVFFDNEPVVAVRYAPDRVQVQLQVGPEGVRIQAPESAADEPAPKPKRSRSSKKSGEPSVKVDDSGLRVSARDGDEDVTVIVDDKGLRVERQPSKESSEAKEPDGVTIEADGRAVKIDPDVVQDPQKLAQGIDSVRDQIEAIVERQIEKEVARETRRYREQRGDWLMSLVMLLIVTGIIVKVVLGGKKRAERRVQAMTETAAEESLKRQLAEAQLKTMQAQVEPHFLFNTLASVDYLIETEPSTASKMQKSLIQYLRAALPQMREGSTTLGKEIQLCRSYLEILKFRMEDRLQYSVIVPQGLSSARFPPMMLQSLVENSIKHGLEPKPEGGSLTISADISNGRLRVTVADSGLGFAVSEDAPRSGSGVGLSNVRERLAALYGGAARLSIEANSPTGTIVTIEVPYTFEADTPANESARA
jgi:Histidine kinase/Histidine kinase-, DNA gyrase B-, and HSP90-like ATPase